MPSLAEQLIQQAGQTDIAGNALQGFQMAQQVKAQRQQVEAARQKLQAKKLEKFSNLVLKGSKIKDSRSRSNFLDKFVPQARDSMGLSEAFPDESLNFITSSPANREAFRFLFSDVAAGRMGLEEALQTARDPSEFAEFVQSKGLNVEGEPGALDITQERFEQLAGASQEARERDVVARKDFFEGKRELIGDAEKLVSDARTSILDVNTAKDALRRAVDEKSGTALTTAIKQIITTMENRISQTDFTEQKRLLGIANNIRSWVDENIKGEVNPTLARQLNGLLTTLEERARAEFTAKRTTAAKQIEAFADQFPGRTSKEQLLKDANLDEPISRDAEKPGRQRQQGDEQVNLPSVQFQRLREVAQRELQAGKAVKQLEEMLREAVPGITDKQVDKILTPEQ